MAANNFLPGDDYYKTQMNGAPNPTQSGLGPNFKGPLPASFGGQVQPGAAPPPGVNPQVVYTDPQSGKGYNPSELNDLWNQGGAFRNDPTNARVGDLLTQYGYGGTPQATQASSQPTTQSSTTPSNPSGIPNPGAPLAKDPRSDQLVNLLMGRAQQGLNISPDDPIIKNQVDAFNANDQRAQRSYLAQSAEKGGPNANTEAIGRSLAEHGAQVGGQLQATLMGNELSARRQEIQQALQESGNLLTSDQQMQLQHELGLIDANLRQQGITSGNDQFLANLGLQTQNQSNYWGALNSGLLG